MKLVDVHCHLNHKRLEEDLDKVVERFIEGGGEVLITSGVNKTTNRETLEIAKRFEVVRATFGIYPTDALVAEMSEGESNGFARDLEGFDVDEELGWIKENKESCVAIGEIGLDYNWKEFQTEEMREKQKEIFRKCLKLSKEIDKPVVIHSRRAEADAIDILESQLGTDDQAGRVNSPKVVMHCFNGKKSLIRRCVENGWSFSVPAVIMRLEHFKMLVEMVPLSQLLTETDAPYLSPVVGKRNEPANVLVTLEEIARIKGLGVEKVGEEIFNNTVKLFGL